MGNTKNIVLSFFIAIVLQACGGDSYKTQEEVIKQPESKQEVKQPEKKEETKQEVVINQKPVAKAGEDKTIQVGSNVDFDGSASSDSDGTIVEYKWYEGDTLLSSEKNFSKSDFTVGEHTIKLTVKDDKGASASNEVKITVNTAIPQLVANSNVTVSLDPSNNATNVTIDKLIKATFSSDMKNETLITSNFVLKEGTTSVANTFTKIDSKTVSVKPNSRKLKKTGQTKSYNQAGNVVSDGSVKDDGFYQKGEEPNFKRDDNTNIVHDLRTGLMWQDEVYTTAEDTAYSNDTEEGKALHWQSAVDYSKYKGDSEGSIAAINSAFKYIGKQGDQSYWSATTEGSTLAWSVDFKIGHADWKNKTNTTFVRCSR